MEAFSQAWADAYRDAINNNEAYTKAAANWDLGRVALVMRGENVGILLDLAAGQCHNATRMSHEEATEQAAFVIVGDEATWRDVLEGRLAPLMGIMRGKLKLEKGSIAKLMPYANASVALVNSAQAVPTDWS